MNPDLAQILSALDSLRQEVAALSSRVATLEGARPESAAGTTPAGSTTPDEVVAIIAAAVAASLGVRAHVRQIRLVSSPAWGMQGRVTIQASHDLPGH